MADIPKIRFKGFTEPWEQRKLGEVFEQTTNLVSPNEDEIELWSLTVEDGLTPKSERYNREFLVKKDNNFKEVRPGDIVYNPMNMTLGAVGYNGMAKSVAVSGYYTTMITKKGYDAYYINTWLKSPQAILLYKTYATGSLIEKQRVQFPTLSIIPAAFPNYDEQTKIGQYFESLDNLITLHQRKCDDTKELKKYMLQKMFPKNGEKFPEIRFKGFTEAWEQRKVSETAEIVAGGTPSTSVSEYWEPKEVPWLSSGEVHKKYVTYTDDMISKLGLSNSSAKMIKENSILIALAGQGKTRGTVAINRISLSTNQSIAAMTFNDDIIPEFVFSNLENRYDEIRAMSSGDGSRGGLNKQLVGNIVIPYTIIEEQRKIGAYFENLDNLITLHQRKCDTLKELKKYMLQNMFPKKG